MRRKNDEDLKRYVDFEKLKKRLSDCVVYEKRKRHVDDEKLKMKPIDVKDYDK